MVKYEIVNKGTNIPSKDTQVLLGITTFLFYHYQMNATARDSRGISKLPLKQLILPYKIICLKASSEIPLLSLVVVQP